MSDFLSRLDELKIKFLENYTDASALLEIWAQLDDLEETTGDSIKMPLTDALKRIMFNQQLDSSKCATVTWKYL